MDKMAINIVLVPNDKMLDMAYDLNEEITKTGDKWIEFDDKTFPHITLAMGVIEEDDISKMIELLEQMGSKFQKIFMKVDALKSRELSNGKTISEFTIAPNREVEMLHEMIINRLRPFLKPAATKETFVDDDVDPLTIRWVNSFLEDHSEDNYKPHITLGAGVPKTQDFPFPMLFNSGVISFCKMGDGCTCKEIIHEFPIGRPPQEY